jgi:hypothetical protein
MVINHQLRVFVVRRLALLIYAPDNPRRLTDFQPAKAPRMQITEDGVSLGEAATPVIQLSPAK